LGWGKTGSEYYYQGLALSPARLERRRLYHSRITWIACEPISRFLTIPTGWIKKP
jgi:hypothetical protein